MQRPTLTAVTCTTCGASTTVPFVPTPGRPVLCASCHRAKLGSMTGGRAGGGPRARPVAPVPNAKKRMLAQGRKGHFMHDAKAILLGTEGGVEDANVRAFLEGLFARGARDSTEAAQAFLDEKAAESTVTPEQREKLGRLLESYSFRR